MVKKTYKIIVHFSTGENTVVAVSRYKGYAELLANHELIYKYMKAYKLDLEEWYDVLIIPYLQAVKKYFSYLDLREYKFEKICFRILDSARKNHWIKAERRKCYPSGKYF